jgi:hypothetical protein
MRPRHRPRNADRPGDAIVAHAAAISVDLITARRPSAQLLQPPGQVSAIGGDHADNKESYSVHRAQFSNGSAPGRDGR